MTHTSTFLKIKLGDLNHALSVIQLKSSSGLGVIYKDKWLNICKIKMKRLLVICKFFKAVISASAEVIVLNHTNLLGFWNFWAFQNYSLSFMVNLPKKQSFVYCSCELKMQTQHNITAYTLNLKSAFMLLI